MKTKGISDESAKKKIGVIKRLNNVFTDNSENYDNFKFLINDKKKIRKWLIENLSASTSSNYALAVRHAIDSMDINDNIKDEAIRFYLDISAESQRVANRITGRVVRDFQPLRAIEAINSMFQHRPKVIVNIESMPKVEKVDNAMPILPESSASIEDQIDAFVDSGKTRNGKPYSKASKYVYSQNIKTLMQRMREPNLDFLVKKVPQVLAHLDKVDEPSALQDAYHARLSSRAFETVAVVFLPLARTKDHNERIVAKHQYNEWLKVNPMLLKAKRSSQRLWRQNMD